MARYVIDRIENGWAALEDENTKVFNVPTSWLPPETREGDVLRITISEPSPGTCTLQFAIDPEARQELERKARELRDTLPRGPDGDIAL